MQRILFPVVLLGGCGGTIQPQAVAYAPTTIRVDDRPPIMTGVLDPSTASIGLPSLAHVTLPMDTREIRMSRGHGMMLGAEYPLIRIIQRPTGVSGEVIRFHAVIEGHDSSQRRMHWAARVVRPTQHVDWLRVLQVLDSVGIDSFVPPRYSSAISDAGDLTVEVRRGKVYRSYEVNAPQLRTDSTSARAARIAAFVDLFERLTRGYD